MTEHTITGVRSVGSDVRQFKATVDASNGEDPEEVFLGQVSDPDEFTVQEVS